MEIGQIVALMVAQIVAQNVRPKWTPKLSPQICGLGAQMVAQIVTKWRPKLNLTMIFCDESSAAYGFSAIKKDVFGLDETRFFFVANTRVK